MKELAFIEGPVPAGFRQEFESLLFNTDTHRHLQAPTGWRSFSLVRSDKQRIICNLNLYVNGGVASSPVRAPYASVEWSQGLELAELYTFLKTVEDKLKLEGVGAIRLKNPPEAFAPAMSAALEVILLNLGYHISSAEITATLPVTKTPYESNIDAWELRKLKQTRAKKLRFKEMHGRDLEKVYEFILSCRTERNQNLSMTFDQVHELATACKGSVVLFGAEFNDQLAAASISIRVNKKVLYNFYSAHPRAFDSLSPVVFLIHGIYQWAQKKKFSLIDLGTSSLEGRPNFNLLNFKFRLGGIPSTRFTFEKSL